MNRHSRWFPGWVPVDRGLIALIVAMLAASCPVMAQTPPPSFSQQPQQGQTPQMPGTLPLLQNPFAQQSTITSTASGASAPQSNTIPSSQGKSFGTIGKGLPGMTGGPALTAPMGSQDPSSRYMRPTVIPPLFCDPAINIPC